MNHVEMMRLAESVALRSVCKRAQVGVVLAHPKDGDRYFGWNYRPTSDNGWKSFDGCCEDDDGKTLPDVLHAEYVAISKAMTYQDNLNGWTMYVTRQPCIDCAKLIVNSGVEAVYYRDADDKTDGLEWLDQNGVHVDSGWILGQVQKGWAERSGQDANTTGK